MKLVKNTYQIVQVTIVILMILLSGSTMYVISSLVFNEHECCCCKKSSKPINEASFKCNKECCTLVETNTIPFEESIPVVNNNVKNTDDTLFETAHISINFAESSFIVSTAYYKPQKIFITISVIRI